ncbi:hypothetical protein AXF42_Ash004376 [Apostasia shenzhenica]|uniref:Uncharacterized protein n=1 Tax=Apostasia shenzhenica TaxID=1088818 RepID=A0A2I0A2S4_9ASPA|nr:hypothetical protein AXF42_Ash004376 [Apostasia shenzhenica]
MVKDHPLLTSMTMLSRCTCRSLRGPTTSFLVQSTFHRRVNQGLACSNPHRFSGAVLRSRGLALLLLTLVPPVADKQHEFRICLLPLLPENQDKAVLSTAYKYP